MKQNVIELLKWRWARDVLLANFLTLLATVQMHRVSGKEQVCPYRQMRVQGNPKFLEIVTNWQRKLGTVDVVLNTWLDVQKKWQALESIFVGSADIRVQLPEDSKRFDVINADFQVRCLPSLARVHS